MNGTRQGVRAPVAGRVAACLLVGVPALLSAQVVWERIPQPGRSSHAMAFDPARQEIVMFGGYANTGSPLTDETWVWNATNRWVQVFPPTRPSPDSGGDLVGIGSGRALWCGGPGVPATWEWHFATGIWVQRLPAHSPPSAGALAFDSGRNRVVLVRDPGYPGPSLETWEWDGVDWTLVATAFAGGQRGGFGLAYDPVNQRTVLHGGIAYQPGYGMVIFSDTWLWNGTAWAQAASGSPRVGHRMVFDSVRGRTVAFGGYDGSEEDGEVFEWDGLAWTWPWRGPLLGRSGHGMVFDGQATVVFGGSSSAGKLSDMWRWNGAAWTQVQDQSRPAARSGHAMAWDSLRRQHVLFGGNGQGGGLLGDTWLLQGRSWLSTSPATAPATRYGHGMVYDRQRDRVVLFGGARTSASNVLNDTWEWDGSVWLFRAPPASPPPRHWHAMAYDERRGRVVLFGGNWNTGGVNVALGDTWEWDGATWSQRLPAASPAPMANPTLAWDRQRQRTVLFGPSPTGSATWEWDGTNWLQRSPVHRPPAGYGTTQEFQSTYDAAGQRVVLLAQEGRETWEWDGTDWSQRATATTPPVSSGFSFSYDEARGRAVLFGGINGFVSLDSLWEYGPVQPASVTSFGSGCAGSAGTPALNAVSLPWIGNTFQLEGSGLPANGLGALLFLGASRTSAGGVPLPLDLTGAGMPGCFLRVSLEMALFAPAYNGLVHWSLPICACPELIGALAFTQFAAVDAAANPAGLSWSQATEDRIGGR